jgi:hypothetical protein
MHQLRHKLAQKPQLDLIADRMSGEHCAALAFSNETLFPEKDWAFIALPDDESLWLYHGAWSRIEIPQATDL